MSVKARLYLFLISMNRITLEEVPEPFRKEIQDGLED